MAGCGWEQAGVFQVGEAQEKSAEKIFAETLFLIPPKPMQETRKRSSDVMQKMVRIYEMSADMEELDEIGGEGIYKK